MTIKCPDCVTDPLIFEQFYSVFKRTRKAEGKTVWCFLLLRQWLVTIVIAIFLLWMNHRSPPVLQSLFHIYVFTIAEDKMECAQTFRVGSRKLFNIENNQNYAFKKNLQLSQVGRYGKTKQCFEPVWAELVSTYHIQHPCTVLSLPKIPDLVPCVKTNQILLHSMEITYYMNFSDI